MRHFSSLNKEIYDLLSPGDWRFYWESLSADAAALNQEYAAKEDGHLIANYPMPVFFPFETYRELQGASEILLRAMHTILKKLLQEMSPHDVLNMFYVPAYLESLIDWQRLADQPPTLGRGDIIFADETRPLICEFNIDSSVGGGDVFMYVDHAIGKYLHLFPPGCRFDSFYHLLADHLIEVAGRHGKTSIGLFIWSDWIEKGLYNMKYIMDLVKERGFEIEKVSELDVKSGRKTVGDRLMCRAFVSEHIADDLDFVADLLRQGMVLVSDLGDDIYSSKVWFGVLHDDSMTSVLSQEEKETIRRYLPRTVIVDRQDLDELIESKDAWIFKPVDTWGGKGILIGEEAADEEIRARLSCEKQGWIAQEYIKDASVMLPNGENRQYERFNAVFGLYKTGTAYSGLLLRVSQATKIVNAGGGKALISWAVPVE
jgi:glutathionylspermidine synthase